MKRLNSVSSISISPVKQQKTKIFFTPKIDPFTKYIDFQKVYAKKIAQWDQEDQEEEMEMEDNQDMQDMKNKMRYQIYFHEMHDNPENMQDYLYDFTQDLNPFDDTLKEIEKHAAEKLQRSLRRHFLDPNLIQHQEQHRDPKKFNREPPISLSKNQTREFLETRAPKVKPSKQNTETEDYSNSLQQLFTESPALPPSYMEKPDTRKRRKTHKQTPEQEDYSKSLQTLFNEAPSEVTHENAWERLDAVNNRISELKQIRATKPKRMKAITDSLLSLQQAKRTRILPYLSIKDVSFDEYTPDDIRGYQYYGLIPLVSADLKKVVGYINEKRIKEFARTNEDLTLPLYGPGGSVLGSIRLPFNDIVRFQHTPSQHHQGFFF